MPTVRSEVTISAPITATYAAAKDIIGLKPYLKDVPSLVLLEDSETRTKSDWIAVAMGKKIHWIQIEDWDNDNFTQHFHSPEGDFDVYKGSWLFFPHPDGTKVELEIEYELTIPIFGGLLQKLVLKLMKENADGFLDGLRQRVLSQS